MATLHFRSPGHALRAAALVGRALGDACADAAAAVRAGRLRLGMETLRDPDALVAPGSALSLAVAPAEVQQLETGELPQPPLAALAPALPWRRGVLELPDRRVGFERTEVRDAVARYSFADDVAAEHARAALAAADAPVLGDVRHGGRLVEGGLRLAAATGVLAWPSEPVFPADEPELPVLLVSAATLRALARGHPLVLTDPETGDVGRFRPGSRVRLRGPKGAPGPLARVEGGGRVAARVWGPAGGVAGRRDVEARVQAALARRKALLASRKTDAFRLVHGEADALPGLFVDRLGPMLRVLVTGAAGEAVREPAVAVLREALAARLGPEGCCVEVLHPADPPAGRLEAVRLAHGAAPSLDGEGRFPVRERGLQYLVDPGLATPERPRSATGLFLDQRENRARLAARVRPDGRYLNLFAHTGAFSVALLAAGAAEVVSVDLSAAYLRWLAENLAVNGLAGAAHRSLRGDGRRRLENLAGEGFDGIVLDPPTAAAAGRRFFRLRRELPDLLAQCLGALRPGGFLLVTRHERAGRGGLAAEMESAARGARLDLDAVEEAPPGPDFPRLRGFPEGDAFEGVLATRALRYAPPTRGGRDGRQHGPGDRVRKRR